MVTSGGDVRQDGLGRRRFLLAMGALAAGAALGPLGRVVRAESPSLQTHTQNGRALGTEVRITVLHREMGVARRAAEAALGELQAIDALMSIYRADSQVAELNRSGLLVKADARLLEVLEVARGMSERSNGAFDVTVQPLWKVYAEAEGRVPSDEEVRAARARVDWRKVKVSGARARVTLEEGMAITLNGIAQGYAADRCMAALRRHGIEHALVNTGELSAIGRNAEGKVWTAGIQHPRKENAFAALARLEGRCLATSGDYATTFAADREHHHIFDPATGRSATVLASASVVAPTACLADALSTAIFVMGAERGVELARGLGEVDVLLIGRDGRQFATEGFPA